MRVILRDLIAGQTYAMQSRVRSGSQISEWSRVSYFLSSGSEKTVDFSYLDGADSVDVRVAKV